MNRRIFFLECEHENCGFCVEFHNNNTTFFFCKTCRFGINIPTEQLQTNHICGGCRAPMARYDLAEEDNVCPICNDMLSICYTLQ